MPRMLQDGRCNATKKLRDLWRSGVQAFSSPLDPLKNINHSSLTCDSNDQYNRCVDYITFHI